MKEFLVLWSNKQEFKKYVVGHLTYDGIWEFKYDLTGFDEAFCKGFRGFPEFPSIRDTYTSKELFLSFNNRIIKDNKDRDKVLDNTQKIELLEDTRAYLHTDNISVEKIQNESHQR